MSKYVYFTKEQIYRAAHTEIKSFLEAKGEHLLKSGREWMWEANHSVKIRGNVFFDHSNGTSGTAINFVCDFYDMDFQGAVYTLLGDDYNGRKLERSPAKLYHERKAFVLSPRNRNMRRVYVYLMQERHLDSDIITSFARQRTLYESAGNHNCIFVGLDASGKTESRPRKRNSF
jgi:hypothetical protein